MVGTSLPPIEQRRIEVGNVAMSYRRSVDSPARGRRPVVLVHGLGLSGRYMLPVAERLACDVPVYLPDLPGFGDSAKPDGVLDVPGLADALAVWIEVVGLAPAALLGNSLGCQIIADLAARHPGLAERAVLQGPTAPPEERSWFWQFVRWRQNQPYNPDSLSPITWDDYRKCGYLRLLRTFHHQLQDPIEAKVPHIPIPVLVVRGQHDPICRAEWAAELTRLLPDGRHVEIPDVSHTLVYTSPEELAAVTRMFLRESWQDASPPSP